MHDIPTLFRGAVYSTRLFAGWRASRTVSRTAADGAPSGTLSGSPYRPDMQVGRRFMSHTNVACLCVKRLKGRLHGAFSMCVFMSGEPFVAEACDIGLRQKSQPMGLDLLPILPCALPSCSAVAIVGRRARTQQHCQNGRFFLLILCL
jgi:hypothetical protein